MSNSQMRKLSTRTAIVALTIPVLVLALVSFNMAQVVEPPIEPPIDPPEVPEPPASGPTRQPLIQNQFDTTSSGPLNFRRPGRYVQQGLAFASGNLPPGLTGDVPDEVQGWIGETLELIFFQILDIISQLLSGLNFLGGGSNPLGDLLGSSGLGGLSQLTGGSGTTTIQ